ncbi:hypothetical protein [Vibrio navarrensis]|uniref:Uncharacterized protein n=1 Tax=Vibrio navarrensis TaxID=29495 RepID=A0AAJ4IF82_9VIBR|nr:hypothetical protein I3X05_22430 [Vibrio navarrensis]
MNTFVIETVLLILLGMFVVLVALQLWFWLRPYLYDLLLPADFRFTVRNLLATLNQVKPRGEISAEYAAQLGELMQPNLAQRQKILAATQLFTEVTQNHPISFNSSKEQAIVEQSAQQLQHLAQQMSKQPKHLCHAISAHFYCAACVWLCQLILAQGTNDAQEKDASACEQ